MPRDLHRLPGVARRTIGIALVQQGVRQRDERLRPAAPGAGAARERKPVTRERHGALGISSCQRQPRPLHFRPAEHLLVPETEKGRFGLREFVGATVELTESPQRPSQVRPRVGDTTLVAGFDTRREADVEQYGGFLEVAAHDRDPTEVVDRHGAPTWVTEGLVQRERTPRVRLGLA